MMVFGGRAIACEMLNSLNDTGSGGSCAKIGHNLYPLQPISQRLERFHIGRICKKEDMTASETHFTETNSGLPCPKSNERPLV